MAAQVMAPSTKFTSAQIRNFRKRLLRWFAHEQRKLPWRGESDPYRVLVSEVMLQQTRVAVVQERYKEFIQQFPTAEELARTRQQTVLAAWSGLGYYRRARALHKAAKIVSANGGFPRSASALMELPGVGRYTAAAVASIAYKEPAPVVDGNVKRVLTRLMGQEIGEQRYWEVAGELLDPQHPGDFNQAMMELGALVCLPAKPACESCPVAALCSLRGPGPRRAQPARRKAVSRYLLAQRNGSVLLRQRPRKASLMAGMWELPECDVPQNGKKPLLKLRHSITTTDYTVLVFAGKNGAGQGRWIASDRLQQMALTGLAKKILLALAKTETR
jgi:A/G-specific adenine glycosylase